MKKTILIICVAAACILFGLVAFIGLSGRNKNEEQQYRFYYINSDETRLKEEKYTPEKETTEVTTMEQVKEEVQMDLIQMQH